MTARHQIRIGRRLGRDRSVIDAQPAPSLGELLQSARERKGVDLFRAERDTKIRLKYLAALEDDDLTELPPPVYTKGFIRNYALYLGLEPEDVLDRWREQLQMQRRHERVVVAPPPRPLAAPRRGPLITPGMFVAAMLSIAVIAFLGYIGWQVLRFAERPELGLTSPASLVSTMDAEEATLAGTAGLRSRITVEADDGQIYITNASSSDGAWSLVVPLSIGQNSFTVVAQDSITETESDPVRVIITVPLPGATSAPSPVATAAPLDLTVTSPASGATSNTGIFTVSGTTTGTRVTIESEFLGSLPGAPSPDPAATPEPEPTPAQETPGASPGVAPSPSGQPGGPIDISVPVGGNFATTVELAPGRWRLTITAHATGVEPHSETRLVTVDTAASPPPGEGAITLVLEARGGSSWTRIVVDGEQLRPRDYGGPTLGNGETATITAEQEIWIRAGNAGNIHVILNGRELGPLGRRGQVGNWLIVPGSDPQQTTETR